MRTTVVVALVLSAAASSSRGIIVQGTELPPYQPVTNQLATSHGAVFSSLNSPFVTFIELIPGVWGIQGTEPWGPPPAGYAWFNSPIFVNFVDPSDGVTPAWVDGTITCMWGDGGGDLDAVDMMLFDLSNNLIAVQTFSGIGFTQIQMTANGVHRVEFWANTIVGSPTSDTGLDWIDYPTPVVPAPASAALLAAAMVLRRRRR